MQLAKKQEGLSNSDSFIISEQSETKMAESIWIFLVIKNMSKGISLQWKTPNGVINTYS